ncbi:serine/threonine-protein kinase [Leisingera sp. SS27]|uniref:serine/threonine-protein kinase n=1 Tax=Leisingera sp. SS27 TaxID=2979462 RepID=UPI002330B757|nr:serine/threonine-protein kinase [Leisingera sp. SS27]MDC0659426.1 serine/threonine-protein kinase [Leisingera sp. SS27]
MTGAAPKDPKAQPFADAEADDRTQIISEAQALSMPRQPTASQKRPQTETAGEALIPAGAGSIPLARPETAAAAAVSGLSPGTVINNNYRIQAALKSGGMGEVYRGIEIGTEDPVAIKAIRPELISDVQAGDMFRREARTLRLLTDDAIVRYYNYVHDRDLDRYFLVMEFIGGIPLSDHLRQFGPLPGETAKVLLQRLARGLAKAHSKGVVHRDLSPDNVMLPDGIVSEARLIDFGIARAQTIPEGASAGKFAGKFKYVAPEQLGHFGGATSPATDIYGLALLTAAALLGKPLEMGSSISEAAAARRVVPDLSLLPEEIQPLLARMLEPNPAKRPATMQDVLHLLEGLDAKPALSDRSANRRPLPASGVQVSAAGLALPPQATIPDLQFPASAAASSRPPPLTHAGLGGAEPKHPKTFGTSRKAAVFVSILLFTLAGAAGWHAWQTGLLQTGLAAPAFGDGQLAAQPPAPAIPPPSPGTREGFLAGFGAGGCSFATRLAAGPNAGVVETYSVDGSAFEALPAAYEERFGTRPALQHRALTPEQCAAADLARALQGRQPDPVQLTLSGDQAVSGETLQAEVHVPAAQSVWVVLISAQGNIYNLTNRLTHSNGANRHLEFAMALAPEAKAAPQLVLAVASDTPLVRAATAADGKDAADLLPQVLAEIQSNDGQASAALSYVLLSAPVADTGVLDH